MSYRRQMGIRREMMMTGLARLTPTRAEIGGWPPLAVSFQHPQDLPPLSSQYLPHLLTVRQYLPHLLTVRLSWALVLVFFKRGSTYQICFPKCNAATQRFSYLIFVFDIEVSPPASCFIIFPMPSNKCVIYTNMYEYNTMTM